MKTNNIIKLVFILIAFFCIGDLCRVLFNCLGFDISTFNYTDWAYAEVLMSLILGALVIIVYRKKLSEDLFEFNKDLKKNMMKSFNLFIYMYIIKIIASIVSTLLASLLGIEMLQSNNQNIIDALAGSAPIMMVISSVILAPFIEEGIFRLGLKKVTNNKYIFIVISGLIFGLMHIFPTDLSLSLALIQSIVYLAMGFSLAYIYTETENIYHVISVHAINNLIGIIALLLLG